MPLQFNNATGSYEWVTGTGPDYGYAAEDFGEEIRPSRLFGVGALDSALGRNYQQTPWAAAYAQRAYSPLLGQWALNPAYMDPETGTGFAAYTRRMLGQPGGFRVPGRVDEDQNWIPASGPMGGFDPRNVGTAENVARFKDAVGVARAMGTVGEPAYKAANPTAYANYERLLSDEDLGEDYVKAIADLAIAGSPTAGGLRGLMQGRGIARQLNEWQTLSQNPTLGGVDYLGYLASILPESSPFQVPYAT